MTTKDLLKLSPEGKKEVWFEKFLWEKKKPEELSFPSHLEPEDRHLNVYVDNEGIERCIDCVGFPDILDSLSDWHEFVEKPMGEIGFGCTIRLYGEFIMNIFMWATISGECEAYSAKIQNGQIFLASLDAAFHIPQVSEIINKRSNQNEI